jgi:GTPase
MTTETAARKKRAVLVGVQLPGVDDADHEGSLAELNRLVTTLGYEVVGQLGQKRKALDGGVVLGEGKLVELASWTGGPGVVQRKARKAQKKDLHQPRAEALDDLDDDEADDEDDALVEASEDRRADVVVVDHDLTPMQFRNLVSVTSAEVLDRSGVIVEIFHRHASSREARLQVELARLKYVAPRLRASGGGFDRQGGGVGAKGAGESQLELDRRKIRDRIAEIGDQLKDIESARSIRRQRRHDSHRVALVGYTNAGKSSWMRKLTETEVLVEDKLFATLDTTVRALQPETRPRILVSDTVGFIKKLPHDLVASFRSTLDEALEASLLVHVVDASDPTFRGQLEVTRTVLADIGADTIPTLLLLNKWDRVAPEAAEALRAEFPEAVSCSAKDPADVARIRELLVDRCLRDLPVSALVVPYDRAKMVGEIRETTTVVSEDYEDDGIHYQLRASEGVVKRLREQLL